MTMTLRKRMHAIILTLPITGMLLFVVFYVIAAIYYPGGSYASPAEAGFSFRNNYLCDLLDDRAINGAVNDARLYSRIALALLCLSVILLWLYVPKLFPYKSKIQILMRTAGILSMVTTFFLASGIHDIIVRIAGVFGVIALLSVFAELYKYKYYKLLILGILCFIQFLANFYIYETQTMLNTLPLIQKVTFASCIGWFILLNIAVFKRFKNSV